jgi:ATP-dependent DNA helicase RecG
MLTTDNYQAQTRNKLIAEAFYLTNDTEKYGSGYTRVRNENKITFKGSPKNGGYFVK